MSNSWACLGVTYRRIPHAQRPPAPQHHLPAGPQPLLVVPGVGLAQVLRVAHSTQTVLHGGYHRTLGVALECGAGCLSYGVASGVSLIYRFLASFLERSTPRSWSAAAPRSPSSSSRGRRRRPIKLDSSAGWPAGRGTLGRVAGPQGPLARG